LVVAKSGFKEKGWVDRKGEHRAEVPQQAMIVVEGFFDCLKVHQAGLPCVVALMGCSLSEHQETLLLQNCRHSY